MRGRKKKTSYVAIAAILPLFLLAVVFLFGAIAQRYQQNFETALNKNQHKKNLHPSLFFDEQLFYKGISEVGEKADPFPETVLGGIIPHHLLPGFIIAEFFSRLSAQKPQVIVLIGPNHENVGDFPALTSLEGWETPFGIVLPEEAVINDMVDNNILQISSQVLEQEHSVSSIIPFIKYYLPEAAVVPVILSSSIDLASIDKLGSYLANNVSRDKVLVASVDFSHYLTSAEAREKDEETLGVLKNLDIASLLALNNDNLDSPASIAVLLLAMQNNGIEKFEILHHTNSGELLQDETASTTSYFSIIF